MKKRSVSWRPVVALLLPFVLAATSNSPLSAADSSPALDQAVVEALLRLPKDTLTKHPERRESVLRYLERRAGTSEYLQVARDLGVFDQTQQLLSYFEGENVDGSLAADAARLLVRAGKLDAIEGLIRGEDTRPAVAAATALGYVQNGKTIPMLSAVVSDSRANRQVRIAAIASLGRSNNGQQALLNVAENQGVDPGLNFAFSEALLASRNKEIKTGAKKILEPVAAKGNKALPSVAALAKMRGNAPEGKKVFETIGTCNQCHKVGGAGKDVGPDLSEIGSKLSREAMFVAILNPSAAVSHNYEMYSALDVDGNVTKGLLINKNDAGVTIRNDKGVDFTIAADDLEELQMQPTSLMPADLQQLMTVEELVSLVDYLVLLRKPQEKGFNAVTDNGAAVDKRDPDTAVDAFDVADGLEAHLWASEPMMLSPTSIDVDSKGRVWVCEAVNYRHFRNGQNEPREQGDRILVLEDTDQDGKADKRTVFYQGRDIDSPHGVTVLGDRVIVSAGENVHVFRDADGDLKPESREKLFTGISGVQHDHGIHAFGIGPDGKLYFNFGNEGKQLKGPTGETIVDKAGNVVDDTRNPYQQGMAFRCNLDGSELETLGWNFRNNWELCVDSFGNIWQSDNDDDGNRGTRINFVMEFGNYGYRDELTGDTWRVKRTGLEGEVPLQHWHLNDPGVVPNILQTGAGSPTGICFYEGDLLPEEFRNQMIHCDPGPNVVRAYPVEEDGAGYKASIRNMVKGVRDTWFRPVDVCAAPDGSLFVADWYDPGVGGHRMGDVEHGRIFRVVPTGHKGYEVPEIDLTNGAGACEALESPNMATRCLAQQALGDMGSDAVESLVQMARGATSDRLLARALWQLANVGGAGVKRRLVQRALEHENPSIRITAIRIARQHGQEMLGIVEQMKQDPSSHVRRELAIALRHNRSPKAAELWVDLAVQHDGRDRWYVEALGIAADKQWDDFFQAWLDRVGTDWNTPGGRDIVWRCRSPLACDYLTQIIVDTESEAEQLRYFRAFDFHEGESKARALESLVAGN
ncbi:MAG: hypothetical protein Aurels2KO_23780 [Aureliella sp.]